jgi:hypothetical protein
MYSPYTLLRTYFRFRSAQRIEMAISGGPEGEAPRNNFRALPTFLCPSCCANTIGALLIVSLTGEV